MQTWAKRGLRTALVTGGLLMLGTGIASADEDVNPDKPASPLDGSANIPVHIDNNALGTPLGQKNLHPVHTEVRFSTSDVAGAAPAVPVAKGVPAPNPAVKQVKQKVADTVSPVATSATGAVPSVTEDARDQAAPLLGQAAPVTGELPELPELPGTLPGLPGTLPALPGTLPAVPSLDKADVPGVDALDSSPAAGNRARADVVVPVDVSGNAVAVFGKAETVNDTDRGYGTIRDVDTTGAGGFVSGNVVDLDWAQPVQVTNNSTAVVGTASATGTSSQEAWATGDIVTDGAHSGAGGNVVAPQFATPVQVDGNAVAGAGKAHSYSEADSTAMSGGSVLTSGKESVAGGNAVPVPVAVPVKANGSAVMGVGEAVAEEYSSADAQAGRTRTGKYGVPTYVETDGAPALAAGNVAQPAVSGPALLCGNAGGAAGTADATCGTASTTIAGGTSRTSGEGSVLSGAIASAPVAAPAEGFGNAPVVLGTATARTWNLADATAGGDSYTRGHESVLSGTTATTPMAGTADVFNNSATGAGKASSTVANNVGSVAGGHTGTTGDDSVVGGNAGTVPVALPVEAFGNATGAAGGGAQSAATETKGVTAGSGTNTADDNGLLASNLAAVPVATAVQAFGNGAGLLAVTDARGKTTDAFSAGGDNKATGTAGIGSGNIGQAPVALPVQLFGNGVSGLAKGKQAAVNDMDMQAGGDAISDGTDATGSGNVVTAPVAGAGQFYGESVAGLGLNRAAAASTTGSEAGGDTKTSGASGLAAGNVASPQAMPVVQGFATAVSGVSGVNSAKATNNTVTGSGGDIDTDGTDGVIAGNLADVPAAAVVQPYGDAVAGLGGKSAAAGTSNTQGAVAGTSTTKGDAGRVSGVDGTVPVGAGVPVYNVPVDVLAKAITESAGITRTEVGDGESQLFMPVTGGLAPTELPSIIPQPARSVPVAGSDGFVTDGLFTGVLVGFTESDLAETPDEFHTLPAPHPVDRGARMDPTNRVVGRLIGRPAVQLTDTLGNDFANHVGEQFGNQFSHHLSEGLANGVSNGVSNGLGTGLGARHPLAGVHGNVNGVPVGGEQRDLPTSSQVPGLEGVLAPLSGASVNGYYPRNHVNDLPVDVPPLGELNDATTLLPAVPAAGEPTDVTEIIPVVPAQGGLTGISGLPGAADPSEVTAVIPVVPADYPAQDSDLPAVGGLSGITGLVPGAGARTVVLPGAPDLGGVTGLLPGLPLVGDVAGDGTTVPSVPDLGDVTGLVPGTGARTVVTPETPDLGGVTNLVPGLPVLGGLSGARTDVPGAPALGNASELLPSTPEDSLSGVQATLPRLPAPDSVSDVTGLVRPSVFGRPVPGDLSGFPAVDGLSAVEGLVAAVPVARDAGTIVPGVPDLGDLTGLVPVGGRDHAPTLQDLTEITAVIPVVPGGRALVPAVPVAGDLSEVTAVIPVVPAERRMAPVLPVVPAMPGAGSITSVPVVQAPSFGTLPVPAPEVRGFQTPRASEVSPQLDESSLDSTRAALANLFTTNPIA